MAGKSAPGRNVQFHRPEDPSFLKAFKSKVGYKEPDPIDAKFKKPEIDESKLDDREEREDEQPTVVVLKPGDLSHEEYKEVKERLNNVNDEPNIDGVVKFKKPGTKRSSSSSESLGGLNASTKKKDPSSSMDPRNKDSTGEAKGVKDKGLLSFQEDEDEDDS